MKGFSPLQVWGSSPGLAGFAPSARLLAGGCLSGALVATDYSQPSGVIWWTLSLLLWTSLARPRYGLAAGAALVAAALSAGFAGTLWPAAVAGGAEPAELASRSWDLILRGAGTAYVSASLLGAFQPGELWQGLLALRVPANLAGWLISVLLHTGTLWEETVRLGAAVRLRLPAGRRERRRLLTALPQVWLLRLANRAERVHLAMLARGWPRSSPPEPRFSWRTRDVGFLAVIMTWCTVPWWGG